MFAQGNTMSVAPTLQNLRIGLQEETEWQEQGAREAAWKLAKSVLKLKEHERATFFSPSENRCLPASTLNLEEREFVVDSGASMHMISKKDLINAEMDTLTKSCSPTTVITANEEVQTHEEATVCVKELDIFLTMKRTRQQFYRSESFAMKTDIFMDQQSKATSHQKRYSIHCNTENFVPIVVPGLSSSSSGSSSTSRTLMKQEYESTSSSSSLHSSTSMTPSRQEIDHLTSGSSSSTSPTMTF